MKKLLDRRTVVTLVAMGLITYLGNKEPNAAVMAINGVIAVAGFLVAGNVTEAIKNKKAPENAG